MHSLTNVIEFPQRDSTDDDGPRFFAWRWDRGAITITLMGFDDGTDDTTLLTFSPEVGVEIGEPTVLALSGEPTMLCFKGSFDEHRDIFSKWDQLAQENDRPAIFDREGLAGLAHLPKLPDPPLPDIDEARTAHENEVLRVSRQRVEIAGKVRDLTLDDCIKIAEAVGRELAPNRGPRSQ